MTAIPRYRTLVGPAILSAGFRPFFLGASIWAAMAIPLGLQVHPTLPILYNGFVVDKALGVFVFDPQGHLFLANVINNVGAGP